MSMSEMAMIAQGLATAREMEDTTPPPSPPTPTYDEPDWGTIKLYKHTVDVSLGLRFMDPATYDTSILRNEEGVMMCIVESVAPNSIAATGLRPGDRVVAIEGEFCSGPAEAATMLRSLEGYIRLEVVHDALGRNQHARVRTAAAAAAADVDLYLSDDDEAADKGAGGSSSSSSPDGTPRPTGSNSPERPAGSTRSPRPTLGAFHLNLPADGAPNPAIVGAPGHLRLSAQGSSGRLLKSSGVPLSPRERSGSLSARMRQIGTMLSPRA